VNDQLEVLYFKVTDLWKKLCEEHSKLLDITFDEYSLLLRSEIESVEEKTQEKNIVIKKVNGLDKLRSALISEVNSLFEEDKVENVTDLLKVMHKYEQVRGEKHLFRFNKLLIDIIEKIQIQNKKNQLFINKVIMNLREIREDAVGKKSYSTYNAKGSTSIASTP